MIYTLIGAVIFSLITVLYVLFILGAPLGEYAMGGQHKVLPLKNRIITFFAILIQIFGITVLLQGGNIIEPLFPAKVVKVTCYVFAVYLTLNVLMNAVSRSKKERYIMTPLSIIVAMSYWITALNL